MAKKEKQKSDSSDSSFQQTSSSGTEAFLKGLVRDFDENFDPDNSWSYARNAVNNSVEGNLGAIANEPSNYKCAEAPYTVIGRIHLFEQYWAIFSTDNTNSEIGLYDEEQCYYRTVVNDPCLNFSTFNLVTGASKENFDCSWGVYFADALNPDRFLSLGNPDLWPTTTYSGENYYADKTLWPGVPWNQNCTTVNDCTTCINTNTLNCEKLRINSLVKTPCIKIKNGAFGGNLFNGTYFAFIAYSLNGQRYGDYSSPSNPVAIFNHDNIGGSIQVEISNLEDSNFTEFQLVIMSVIDQVTSARLVGTYNTAENITLYFDTISDSLPSVPIELLPIKTPLYETSDAIFDVNNYLLKVGPKTSLDFNYQPLANQISAEWVAAKYPAEYYKKGGYVMGYMRDEVYSFFIRWIYATGERSKSYHIPGRAPLTGENSTLIADGNVIFSEDPYEKRFEVYNTATGNLIPLGSEETVEDGGVTVASGSMAYWESTEVYPDDKPEIWNASYDPQLSGVYGTDYDLCGKPIRHHKMPEDIVGSLDSFTRATASGANEASHINILGVRFNNIKPPVYKDQNGQIKVVPNIVGYEILRGSRLGNKSIVAKGLINNMRRYPTATNEWGLYPNYPYNPVKNLYNTGGSSYLDPTLSTTSVAPDGSNWGVVTENDVKRDHFTFHSPDTSFYKPFLSAKELRLYTEVGYQNNVDGNFEEAPGHPKEKLLTDLALITALVIGIGEAALAVKGDINTSISSPRVLNLGILPIVGPSSGGGSISIPPNPVSISTAASNTTIEGLDTALDATGINLVATMAGAPLWGANGLYEAWGAGSTLFGGIGRGKDVTYSNSTYSELPTPLKTVAGVITFTNLTTTATNANLDLIEAMVKWRQYAVRYTSRGILHKDSLGNVSYSLNNKRRKINDAGYLDNQFSTFNNQRVNNLYRSSTVAVNVEEDVLDPSLTDTSINSIGTNVSGGAVTFTSPFEPFKSTASCYYGGLKVRNRNQYGQIDTIKQIPIPCPQMVNNDEPIPDSVIYTSGGATLFLTSYTTPVLFGGDIYIGRYTEKNTFFYFFDWLFNEPDGTAFNYRDRFLGLYPRYWAIFEDYDIDGFLGSVISNLFNPSAWQTPANNNNLDGLAELNNNGAFNLADLGQLFNIGQYIRFGRKDAYMYLFQSGVRDFYVESEINIDLRDWGELDEQKHYPVLSSLSELFNTKIIKSGNYFKINNSVSLPKTFFEATSWGFMQDRDYNPLTAEFCYRYLPNRVIYSLPNTLEAKKDYWRVFLPNNYKDFRSRVTAIRSLNRNGALILFEHDSPLMIQGTETLETDLGTKITIGDGALFSQPLQSIINTDNSYEYGSCQDKFSIINTPSGIYWICQNQGKIFSLGKGLQEISAEGMRWWFGKFLPFRLLEDFPNFELTDNPVSGIGCQTAYDNDIQMLYFCKKDYELRKDLPAGTTVTYAGNNIFIVNGTTKILLGDARYFNDTSWTVSFDPKSQHWVSFHDWHPDLTIPSRLTFITTKLNSFWRHNDSDFSFCNYYGVNYPFQIEYILDSGQTVNTLRSLEYILESYVYDQDEIDRFHVLDHNFDELVIYNTEQVSGRLILNLAPKDDPFSYLAYPQILVDGINVLYEKTEQKFRVNQFWDITDDRGEFNPNVQRPIWLTGWDGYKRELNPANLNYNKAEFERKKFRHYFANVLFTKKNCENVQMLMKMANNKNLYSPR